MTSSKFNEDTLSEKPAIEQLGQVTPESPLNFNTPATPLSFRANAVSRRPATARPAVWRAQFGRVFSFRQGANHQSVIGESVAGEKPAAMIRKSPDNVWQIRGSVSEIEELADSADAVCGIDIREFDAIYQQFLKGSKMDLVRRGIIRYIGGSSSAPYRFYYPCSFGSGREATARWLLHFRGSSC